MTKKFLHQQLLSCCCIVNIVWNVQRTKYLHPCKLLYDSPLMTLCQQGRTRDRKLNYYNSLTAELSAGISTPHRLCAVQMSDYLVVQWKSQLHSPVQKFFFSAACSWSASGSSQPSALGLVLGNFSNSSIFFPIL